MRTARRNTVSGLWERRGKIERRTWNELDAEEGFKGERDVMENS